MKPTTKVRLEIALGGVFIVGNWVMLAMAFRREAVDILMIGAGIGWLWCLVLTPVDGTEEE